MQVTDAMVRAGMPFIDTGDPYCTPTEDDFREALTAAMAELWRPIEEADLDTKDGVLVAGGKCYSTEDDWQSRYDHTGVVIVYRNDNVWRGDRCEQYDTWFYYEPTHFTPLPTPPRGK